MKKMIAFLMSALMAASAVAVPVSAKSAVPSVDAQIVKEWTGAVQMLSAEELAQVRSLLPEQDSDVQTSQGALALTVTEAVMTVSDEAAVDPALQAEPPVLAQITATMVVLEYREGYEYGVSDGNSSTQWQAGNVFDALTANREYSVRQRLAGRPETESEPLVIRTKDRNPCSIPAAVPIVENRGSDFITLIARPGYEYRINNGSWQTYYKFSNLKPDTEYVIHQRIQETPDEFASEPAELRVKTIAASGPSSFQNFDRLKKYIEANGFEDDLGNSSLGYSVEVDENNVYYFVMSTWGTSMMCNVFNVSEDGSYIAFDTTFLIPKNGSSMEPHSYIYFCYEGEWLEEVDVSVPTTYTERYTDLCFDTVYGSSMYLENDVLSQLFNSTVAMLAGFWDEVIYENLGFGLKGLGFLAYDGLGEAYCALGSGNHVVPLEMLDQREPGCVISGHQGNPYCPVCATIDYRPYIPAKGSHTYDNDCDPDCNVCGELRRIQHIYSFACGTECDLCGAVRTDPLADHSPDENWVCTGCGQTLSMPGDVSGDRRVNVGDVAKVYAHARGTELLTDREDLAAADVSGDGKINLGDVTRIMAHVSGRRPLW